MPQPAFYAGTSGLVLPVPSKSFYPPAFRDKSRLTYYASLFNSIEINSSFYKVPMAATVGKWAASVPPEFRFTFKLHRGITHQKGLIFDAAAVASFFRVIDAVGPKKGCLLVQFPASIKIAQAGQLEKLLQAIREARKEVEAGSDWKLAIEFRDRSWYIPAIYQLLEDHDATVVLHDMPKSATPPDGSATDTIYLRFHGIAGDYRGTYSDEQLGVYAGRVQEWMDAGKTVYVYFNNTIGEAVRNVKDLAEMVGRLRSGDRS